MFETRWNGVYIMPKHIFETVDDPVTYTFNPPVVLGGWLPEQFLCLSASIDAHTVAPAAVATPTTLVSFDSDALVPGDDVRELAQALPRLVRHVELSSPYGHDAFLKEPQALGALLREVLS